jgi:poly [ADP-ribose] polymerase 2/3/4
METSSNHSLRTSKLIMVTADNHNKFYDMQQNCDATFTVTYGRVGNAGVVQTYPLTQWDTKYKEKLRKGYKDQTNLFASSAEKDLDVGNVKDAIVRNLINNLMQYARKSISYHYNVNADQVTDKQIQEAQDIVNGLVEQLDKQVELNLFNETLLQLYAVIPRRMKNVKDNLIQQLDNQIDIEKIRSKIGEEQATLDVMRGQVLMNKKQQENHRTDKQQNILETMNLDLSVLADDKIENQIKGMMQQEAHRFVRAFEVKNNRTNTAFANWLQTKTQQQTELFWHGSRNENWFSILESGLVLRPANAVITGKMFGEGIYFADKFRKSLNYTSLRGSYWANGREDSAFLAVFQVHTGKQLQIQKHETWCGHLNESNLKKRGADYDSLFASGGVDLLHNEYIVYNQNQCTIRYLVEVRN